MTRDLCEDDYYKGYLRLLSQLSRQHTDIQSMEDLTYNQFRDIYQQITQNRNHHIYVIEFNGMIVASCTLLVEPKFLRGGSLVGHIEDVVVDEKHRSLGLGKVLVQYATNAAKGFGCYKVILDCKNELVPFYKKCGLENMGSQMALYF